MIEFANCEMCDEVFKKFREGQKTCSKKCRIDRKNKQRTENWANGKLRNGAPGGGFRLSYEKLTQRHSWASKFHACKD